MLNYGFFKKIIGVFFKERIFIELLISIIKLIPNALHEWEF